LSPAFLCLVLALLFNPLNASLATRAQTHVHHQVFGDDGRGYRTAIMTYFDNVTLFPSYVDLPFILQFLLDKGPSLGIFLSLPKTKLLTLPSNTSASKLTLSQFDHLTTALALLNTFLSKAAASFQTAAS
jgi:hypothetical protein